ncbi:MAG TPA: cysteine desulfurase-like protein, partial [Chloroflexota bacterium]|nr:cysteine desulfurase-like protein [Chloroflexota bacterium]
MLSAPVQPRVDFAPFRARFPALHREVGGRLPAFLDNPAGTQTPQELIDATVDYFLGANANLDGAFRTSRAATSLFREAHAAMANLLGAASADEIVFGQNMTTLTFAVSRSIGRTLQAGDEIIVTNLDHDGNVAPWRALEERGVVIRVADIHVEDCTLDLDDLAAQITPRTKLLAVTHCSNLVGSTVDVQAVCRLAREAGALSYIDAVQYAAHGPIDVQAMDCDFLACSSYKFFGPHMGVLFGKLEHLERLHAYKVRPSSSVPPGKFETGTLNFEGCAGLLGTISYLERVGDAAVEAGGHVQGAPGGRRGRLLYALEAMRARERDLGGRLIAGLQGIPGVKIWGITDPARL